MATNINLDKRTILRLDVDANISNSNPQSLVSPRHHNDDTSHSILLGHWNVLLCISRLATIILRCNYTYFVLWLS